MSNMRFDQASLRRFEVNMDKIRRNVMESVKGALEEHAWDVLEESFVEVPRDTETLANTLYVTDVEEKDEQLTISMGYAGPDTDEVNPETLRLASSYAQDVHEDLGYYHETGKAKFLEGPLHNSTEKFQKRVGDAFAKGLASSRISR